MKVLASDTEGLTKLVGCLANAKIPKNVLITALTGGYPRAEGVKPRPIEAWREGGTVLEGLTRLETSRECDLRARDHLHLEKEVLPAFPCKPT